MIKLIAVQQFQHSSIFRAVATFEATEAIASLEMEHQKN